MKNLLIVLAILILGCGTDTEVVEETALVAEEHTPITEEPTSVTEESLPIVEDNLGNPDPPHIVRSESRKT